MCDQGSQDDISSAQASREDYDASQEPRLTVEFLEDFYRRTTSENVPPPRFVPQPHVS